MSRALRAAAAARIVLLFAVAFGVAPASASALALQPWLNDTLNVVQQGESELNVSSSSLGNGERMLAHAYGFGQASSGSPLGAVRGPVLRFRYVGSSGAGKPTFITLLDFDRDDVPELAVRYEPQLQNASSTSETTFVQLYDVRSRASSTCLTALTTTERIGTGFNVTTENPNENAVDGQLPLSGAYANGAAGLSESLMRSAPPRMVTLLTPRFASGDVTKPVRTTYPAAAAAASTAGCSNGMAYDFTKATGHTSGAAADAAFVRTDAAAPPAGDILNADLRRIAVSQWARTSTRLDAVVGDTSAARTTYPSELSVDFAPTKSVASLTYLWAAKTWTTTTNRSTPNAVIRTESVSGRSDRVKVIVTSGLGQGTVGASVASQCLSRAPTSGVATTTTYEFPLVTVAGGNRRLTVALDDLVGSGLPASGTPSRTWRFQTLSDPGADASAAIDTVPTLAGYSINGDTRGGGCANGSAGGATVFLDRTNTVGVTQPKVDLVPSTRTPARGEDVTFTLDTDTGDRLCSLSSTFALTACTQLTQRYTQAKTDTYLTLDAPSGAWDADRETIELGNSRPVASIGDGPGQPARGTDGTYAIVRGNSVSVPLTVTGSDADPGTTYTYAWTLDGSPVSSAGQTFTPTFSSPGTYVVRATVDDGSSQSNATSVAAVRTITVVRSPDGDLSIDQPARSVAGQPFDLAAQLASAGHQSLSWSWDLDGDGDFDADPARTGRTLTGVVIDTPGERVVRVRATDAGGRIGEAVATINLRRANERPPVAAFSVSPATVASAAAASFDASTSQLSDLDGTLLGPIGAERADVKYRWSFGDGTPQVTTAAPVVQHTFAGSGPAKVTLVVEDARATPSTLSNPLVKTVDVTPGATDANAPRVQFARQDPPPADPVFANRSVTISAAGTTAADGHAPLRYAFDLDGDGAFEKDGAGEPTIRFTPAAAGRLAVRVRVTDAIGAQSTKELLLDVQAEPVKAPTVTVGGPAELRLSGLAVTGTYDAAGSKGNNLDPALTYRWDPRRRRHL
ncbi:MAG: PKD domain-containing protein [Patulibacter minatonensis]